MIGQPTRRPESHNNIARPKGPLNNYVTLFWTIFDPPPFVTFFNVTLTTLRNASLDPPSKRYVIVERPLSETYNRAYDV